MSQQNNTASEPDDEELIEEDEPEEMVATPSRRTPIGKASTAVTVTTGGGAHAPIARTKKSTEYEIMQRRKDVGRLRLRGMGLAQIAKELNVSISAVKTDLQSIQAENLAHKTNFNQDEYVGEHLSVLNEVSEHAWEEFHGASAGSKQRIQALDLIRTTQNDKLKALTDVGLVAKAAQQVEHKIVHSLPWDEKLKEAVAQQMLNTRLTPQLAAPTLDDTHEPGRNLENVQDAEFSETMVAPPPEPPAPAIEVIDPATAERTEMEETLIKKLVGSGMALETAQKIASEGKALADAAAKNIAQQVMDKNTKGGGSES